MNDFINISWIIIQILIGYHLVYPVILYLFLLFKRRKSPPIRVSNQYQPDYAIIVTAYEQTHLLPAVVNSILELNYNRYHVYIIADNCNLSNLMISHPKVSILKPERVLASNIRSHFYAIDRFVREHDVLTIIDSDNLVHADYLQELNVFFKQGFKAIQGVRAPKNLNTTLACLDSARDIYYNFYDGRVLFELGSSATLAGSGMAFEIDLYRECLGNLTIEGAGFDKVLQAEIVKRGHIIAHAPKAIVYDEKTSQSRQLVNQRSRWINTWFKYCRFGGDLLLKGLKGFNRNQFLFGVTLLRPPLFIFILLSGLCMCLNFMIYPIHSLYWFGAFFLFCLSLIIALQKSKSSTKIYKSLLGIPIFIMLQIISLAYSRKANRRSIATKHI